MSASRIFPCLKKFLHWPTQSSWQPTGHDSGAKALVTLEEPFSSLLDNGEAATLQGDLAIGVDEEVEALGKGASARFDALVEAVRKLVSQEINL